MSRMNEIFHLLGFETSLRIVGSRLEKVEQDGAGGYNARLCYDMCWTAKYLSKIWIHHIRMPGRSEW